MKGRKQIEKTEPTLSLCKPASCGFTLIEMLIVVLVLLILAVIVLLQNTGSEVDTKLAALDSNLALVRNAIDRYKTDHYHWPGKLTSKGANCPDGGTAGNGCDNSEQALVDQLTRYTDPNGRSCSTKNATYRYGPYLRYRELPPNPFSGSNKVVISTTVDINLNSSRVDGLGGWKYDVWTGKFIVDDAAFDDR